MKITRDVFYAQYIYQNSKLLEPVVYFADPVKTSSWAVLAEENEKSTWIFFPYLDQPENKINVPLHKRN